MVFHNFDFEFETHAVLRFKDIPSEKTFQFLDSICKLNTPNTIDTTVDYENPEPIKPVSKYLNWFYEKGEYFFSMVGNDGSKTLHSTDAYFRFSIHRNSRLAYLTYGNY